jgi:hypothetical protein
MLTSVEAKLTFADGRECLILITAEGIQRWGADTRTLADAVEPSEAMAAGLADSEFWHDPEAESVA